MNQSIGTVAPISATYGWCKKSIFRMHSMTCSSFKLIIEIKYTKSQFTIHYTKVKLMWQIDAKFVFSAFENPREHLEKNQKTCLPAFF